MIAITPSNMGNTEPPEFNGDTLRIPKRQKRVVSKRKSLKRQQMTRLDKPVR